METTKYDEKTHQSAAGPSQGWPPRFWERAGLAAYSALLWPATPLAAAWMAASPRRRPLLGRFRPALPPDVSSAPLWLHACSVGEVTTAMPLARAMLARWPRLPIVLTVSTPTGFALAREQAAVPVGWFPVDHPLSVAGFFARLKPRALVLVETELWPGVLARAHADGVPVALVSGRLSDRRARSYRRSAPFWRPVLRPLAAAAMQSPAYAERIAELGVPPERIATTGNLKYDAAPELCSPEERAALRASLGIASGVPVLVFGSTREGDEALAAACWRVLRERFPALRVIIAPRHLERVTEARRALGDTPHVLRSSLGEGVTNDAPAILVDTHGELRRMYSLATVAVVCGSFYPGVDGHNPLEPAAQGIATVFGPYMRNFADIALQLVRSGGAIQVATPEALLETLAALLSDKTHRDRLGTAAMEVVRQNQGAIARTLDFIEPVLRL